MALLVRSLNSTRDSSATALSCRFNHNLNHSTTATTTATTRIAFSTLSVNHVGRTIVFLQEGDQRPQVFTLRVDPICVEGAHPAA